jgi:nicotinate phosphoribosyltransferase
VRAILDAGGLNNTTIFASGNLDEYRLQELMQRGAPIDGFGIGTSLDVSADSPYLECAYKLQEYAGRPCRKRSEGKATWRGRKQIFREFNGSEMLRDTLAAAGQQLPGRPLLRPVMRVGRRIDNGESLDDVRNRSHMQLAALPAELRSLDSAPRLYPILMDDSLIELARIADERVDRNLS